MHRSWIIVALPVALIRLKLFRCKMLQVVPNCLGEGTCRMFRFFESHMQPYIIHIAMPLFMVHASNQTNSMEMFTWISTDKVVGRAQLPWKSKPLSGSHLTVAQRVRRENDPWMPRRELLALGGSSMVAASIGGMPVMANLAVCQVECFGWRSCFVLDVSR